MELKITAKVREIIIIEKEVSLIVDTEENINDQITNEAFKKTIMDSQKKHGWTAIASLSVNIKSDELDEASAGNWRHMDQHH